MRNAFLPLAAVSLFSLVALQTLPSAHVPVSASQRQGDVRKAVPESCPVTKPSGTDFVPLQPYWTNLGPDSFWFGTPKLWISLPKNGTWHVLPTDSKGQIAYTAKDIAAYSQKLAFGSQYKQGGPSGVRCPSNGLKVTGERLGTPAPPLVARANTVSASGPYTIVGFDIPALGCWKITGRFEDTELSFVVWVMD